MGKQWKQWQTLFFGFQNHCRWWLQPWNEKTLSPWKESYDKLSILKSKDITLPTKACIVKAMVSPVVMDRCENWTMKFSSVQLLSRVRLFVTPWIAAHQASLSTTNSRSLLKLMSIELVMLSSHLFLCYPPLLLPSVFPIIRVFSNDSTLRMRWPKYWSFSFSISLSNEHPGFTGWNFGFL